MEQRNTQEHRGNSVVLMHATPRHHSKIDLAARRVGTMMRNDGGPAKPPFPLDANTAPLRQLEHNLSQGKQRDAKKKHRNRFRPSTMTSIAPKSQADKKTTGLLMERPTNVGRSNAVVSNKTRHDQNGPLMQSSVRQGRINMTVVQQTSARRVSADHSSPLAENHTSNKQSMKDSSTKRRHMSSTSTSGGILALALSDAQAQQQQQQQRQRGGHSKRKASAGGRRIMSPMYPHGGILALALNDAQALQHNYGQKRQVEVSKEHKADVVSKNVAQECQDRSDHDDSDGDESLAGRNGVEYIAKPNVGMFGELDHDMFDDSSEDGFYESKRKSREKRSNVNDKEKERSDKKEEQTIAILYESPHTSPNSDSSSGEIADEESRRTPPNSDLSSGETAEKSPPTPTTPNLDSSSGEIADEESRRTPPNSDLSSGETAEESPPTPTTPNLDSSSGEIADEESRRTPPNSDLSSGETAEESPPTPTTPNLDSSSGEIADEESRRTPPNSDLSSGETAEESPPTPTTPNLDSSSGEIADEESRRTPPNSDLSSGETADEEFRRTLPNSDSSSGETAKESPPTPTTPNSDSSSGETAVEESLLTPTFSKQETEKADEKESPPSSTLSRSKQERKRAEEKESPPIFPDSRSKTSSPPSSLDSFSTTNQRKKAPSPLVDTDDESDILLCDLKKRKKNRRKRKRRRQRKRRSKRSTSDSGNAAVDKDNASPKKARTKRIASKSTESVVQNNVLRMNERVYAIQENDENNAKEKESPPVSPGLCSVVLSSPTSQESFSTTNQRGKAPSPLVDSDDESDIPLSHLKKRKMNLPSSQGSRDASTRKRKKQEKQTTSNSGNAAINQDTKALIHSQASKKARTRQIAPKFTNQVIQNTGLRMCERVYAIYPIDGIYYWGVVSGGNETTGYSINYDDGDDCAGVSRKNILTVPMFVEKTGNYAPPLVERKPDANTPRMTLEELYEVKCGACVNCHKEDCGRCASCISTSTSNRRQVCLQKLCCNVSLAQKAQPMPPAANFPPGWKFIIDVTRKEYKKNAKNASMRNGAWGLKVLPPTGKEEFYSVEAAMSKRKDLKDVNVDLFYQHIGAPESESSSNSSLPSTKASRTTSASTTTVIRNQRESQSAGSQTFATSEYSLPLAKYRKTGSRVCCMVDEAEHWGTLEEKHRSGPMRSFTVRLEADNSLLERLDPSLVFSEFQYKQKTKKDPPPPSRSEQPRKAPQAPQDAALSSSQASYITTKDDPLVGRNVCFSWIDLEGRNKILYGVVSNCKKDEQTGEAVSFKVMYSSEFRKDVNLINNGSASVIPAESQMLTAPLVRGGCIRYDRQTSPERQDDSQILGHHWNWISPDMRYEDFVEESGSVCQPRLTIAVRGYRLELNVRESSIAGAGNGVYVSCTPVCGGETGSNTQPLVLKAGQLVDLGVYGPFRLEDKKKEAVFFAKNYIHAHKCEEWAFDFGDSQFQVDITDDVTGDIHEEAKKRIFAYVNESNVDGSECIHAEHDAEGSVHYLLGHSDPSQGDFVLPSNGSPVEVFVHYLDGYEKVRVRKGYSFLPDGEEKDGILEEIANEDIDEVNVMNDFGAADAKAVVDFMLRLFTKDGTNVSTSSVHRALVVAVVLQCRVQQLRFERNKKSTGEDASVNVKRLGTSCGNLVTCLLDLIQDDSDGLKMLHASGSMDELRALVLKKQFSNMGIEKTSKLKDLMG